MNSLRGRAVLLRALAGGVTAAAISAVLVAGAPAATAAGGGCNDYIHSGWNVGVCSSDRVQVSGDIYLNSRGNPGRPCRVRYRMYEGGVVTTTSSGWRACTLGHHPQIHRAKLPGVRYWTRVEVQVIHSGESTYQTVLSGNSKVTT
ncbi:hypothetical protein SAMN05444920_11552 [Nonomuraea solani]|uniref:Uncharacterized protein n=1 Tax=Nonomuraea solani TaxID=1144553 RepID=A0A1H6ERN6_9ACTN|nr:hypothetical protein [Nonomuraea solani]SEH00073.1 hypothetical protein SAMN05444920_11552 [Nonomuraea solani]